MFAGALALVAVVGASFAFFGLGAGLSDAAHTGADGMLGEGAPGGCNRTMNFTQAISACEQKSEGDECTLESRMGEMSGTCEANQDGELACRPNAPQRKGQMKIGTPENCTNCTMGRQNRKIGDAPKMEANVTEEVRFDMISAMQTGDYESAKEIYETYGFGPKWLENEEMVLLQKQIYDAVASKDFSTYSSLMGQLHEKMQGLVSERETGGMGGRSEFAREGGFGGQNMQGSN